jgi:hypothetical protein
MSMLGADLEIDLQMQQTPYPLAQVPELVPPGGQKNL